MHQSRIYAIAYVFIALLKGMFWWPTVLTLWYHHISISRLCRNATLVCLSLTNTPQLQCNVMVPHVTPSWLHHDTQVSYSGMTHSRIYATSYSHLAVYVPITLHKARYGVHSPNVMVPSHQYISFIL